MGEGLVGAGVGSELVQSFLNEMLLLSLVCVLVLCWRNIDIVHASVIQ